MVQTLKIAGNDPNHFHFLLLLLLLLFWLFVEVGF
jgi:hypothetical protein